MLRLKVKVGLEYMAFQYVYKELYKKNCTHLLHIKKNINKIGTVWLHCQESEYVEFLKAVIWLYNKYCKKILYLKLLLINLKHNLIYYFKMHFLDSDN